MEKIASMSREDAIEFLKAERNAPLDLDQTALEHGSMMPDEPTLGELNAALKVLRWMRNGDIGLHESWQMPLLEIAGVVRGIRDVRHTPNDPSSATRPPNA
jgi:hypothetical protein